MSGPLPPLSLPQRQALWLHWAARERERAGDERRRVERLRCLRRERAWAAAKGIVAGALARAFEADARGLAAEEMAPRFERSAGPRCIFPCAA